MFNLFGRKDRIVCPRCLTDIYVDVRQPKDTSCHVCTFRVPLAYVRDYKKALPVFIQLFGFPQVGKSMYLDVLRLFLYDMDRVWTGYTAEPITQIDLDHKEKLMAERRYGKPPGSTQKKERDQNEVYIMFLNQMARWQSRFLIMMDHPGEWFERIEEFPLREIPFLQHTPTALMLVSLDNMRGSGRRIDDIVTIYIRALEQSGVNFDKARRRLIIVFTKGDLIPDLPENINDYLISDTMWTEINSREYALKPQLDGQTMAEYVERMDRISQEIKTWIEYKVDGGITAVRLIKRKNIDVRFCVISATGQDVQEGLAEVQLRPRRVLDPFFWALEFQSK